MFDGRTLNHQSSNSTVSPSVRSCLPSAKARATRSIAAALSATSELISPESWYRFSGARSSESGLPAFDI